MAAAVHQEGFPVHWYQSAPKSHSELELPSARFLDGFTVQLSVTL